MWVNIFEADSYDEEALAKVVVSLTVDDMVRQIKQGEVLMSEWLKCDLADAEFRVVVQGRRIGVPNDGIIDVMQRSSANERRIWLPGDR